MIILLIFVEPISGETIIVDDDDTSDYLSLQAAIDNATTGDTILVRNGTYNENLVVNKTLTIIGDGASNTTILAKDSQEHVVTIQSNNSTFTGFNVTGGNYGIYVEGVVNVTLDGVVAWNNTYGISIERTHESKLSNLTFTNNQIHGLVLNSASNNTISTSRGYDNWYGIIIFNSFDNYLYSINVSNNRNVGLTITSSANNIIEDIEAVNNSWSGLSLSSALNNLFLNLSASSDNGPDIEAKFGTSINRAFNATFSDIEINEGSEFILLDYHHALAVNNNATPLPMADFTFFDRDWLAYATPAYGGSDPRTGADGMAGPMLLPEYVYAGSSSPEPAMVTVRARYRGYEELREVFPALLEPTFVFRSASDPPRTFVVDPSGAGDFANLTSALASGVVLPGDILLVRRGNFTENLYINKSVAVIGAKGWGGGAGGSDPPAVVDADGTGSAMTVAVVNVTLANLTLTGAGSVEGEAGLRVLAEARGLRLADLVVRDNDGSGLFLEGVANVSFFNLTVTDNSGDGGSVKNTRRVTFEASTFTTNGGKGLFLWGTTVTFVANSTFESNGYGVYLWAGNPAAGLFNLTILNSTSDGVYLYQSPEVLIEATSISGSRGRDLRLRSSSVDARALDSLWQTLSVDSSSSLAAVNRLWVRLEDSLGRGVAGGEVEVIWNSTVIYATPHFGGTDPATGATGTVGPFPVLDRLYNGSSTPVSFTTNVSLYFEAQSYQRTAETSTPRTEVFSYNLAPTATIELIDPSPATEGDTVSFAGSGADPDGTVVGYSWRSSLVGGFLSSNATFTTSALPPGDHTLYLAVQDGLGLWSPQVNASLFINARPVANISNDTTAFAQAGEVVLLNGSGSDTDGSVVEYLWESDLDGELGRNATLTLLNLSSGNHNLSFTIRDDFGAWSTPAVWLLRVNAPPSVVIEAVTPKVVLKGQELILTVTASDSNGNVVRYRYHFDHLSSNFNVTDEYNASDHGPLATASFKSGNYSVAFYTIDDEGGLSEPAFTWFYVNAPPLAVIESVSVTTNADGTTNVTLTGRGEDDEPLVAFQWRSDVDGVVGSDSSLVLTNLTPGTHSLSLRVQDEWGVWSEWVVWGAPVTVEPAREGEAGNALLWLLVLLAAVGAGGVASWQYHARVFTTQIKEPLTRLRTLADRHEAADLDYPKENYQRVVEGLTLWKYRAVRTEAATLERQMNETLDLFVEAQKLLAEAREIAEKAEKAGLDFEWKLLDKAEQAFKARELTEAKWAASGFAEKVKKQMKEFKGKERKGRN